MESQLRLELELPFDWAGLLAFLAPRAIPGVELVQDGVYRRTVRIASARRGSGAATAERWGRIEARFDQRAGVVHATLSALRAPGTAELARIARVLRRLFDLDARPAALDAALGRDPRLGPILAQRPGIRVPGCWDPFELSVRAVLGQQVTVRGATTLAGRLVERFGVELPTAKDREHAASEQRSLARLFPVPGAIADAELETIGLPRARAATLRSLARAFVDGRLDFETAGSLDDAVAMLTALPGIGPWTAHYIAMRALRHADALPASDLHLRKLLGTGESMASAREVERIAEAWRPFRSYAAMLLWCA